MVVRDRGESGGGDADCTAADFEIGRDFRLDKPRPQQVRADLPIPQAGDRGERQTGQVSQARIRVMESGTPPIVGSCASAKSINASNPRNTISNAAIPTAIFIPCPAPSINATMRLEGGAFASLRGRTMSSGQWGQRARRPMSRAVHLREMRVC